MCIRDSAMVNHTTAEEGMEHAAPINATAEGVMPRGVVLLRPLLLQQGLRLSVTPLLSPKSGNRASAMMQNHRARRETKRPTAVLESPAEVHVIARHAKGRIEPADRVEAGFPHGHVAPRQMLREFVVEQHVRGTPGG